MLAKKKVLVFVSYFSPGFKAGGPISTIRNMVEQLSDEFEFWIVTRDRDLGEIEPYGGIQCDSWLQFGKANIYYVSEEQLTISVFCKIATQLNCDVIYFNSFFDVGVTFKPLLSVVFSLKNVPVIIAPRGEFSAGALTLKPIKKRLFIWATKWLYSQRNILWHASTDLEEADIISVQRVNKGKVFIAKDLFCISDVSSAIRIPIQRKRTALKLVFLSRISPMKNLDYALDILSAVDTRVSIQLDLYGPKEDRDYWSLCESLIAKLPRQVSVNYCGVVEPSDVVDIFTQYDLFFFPTRGENYGHVIAEALSVGTLVLISDQTPWHNLETDGLGWSFSLSYAEGFISVINRLYDNVIESNYHEKRVVRIEKAMNRLQASEDVAANRALFQAALENIER